MYVTMNSRRLWATIDTKFAHAFSICAPMTPTCWLLTINERGSPQRLLHKVAIEVWLWIVQAFHTSLRYDGTVVRGHNEVILPGFSRLLRIFGCHRYRTFDVLPGAKRKMLA